jgi:mono/diheme cytochrome c family protein
MRFLIGSVVVLLAACGVAKLFAADPPPRVSIPALPPMEEASAPGLKLTLESNGVTDVRPARLISLRVETGSAPSPFLAPGPFKATWEGDLLQRIKGDYNFLAIGRGTLKVTVNEQPALDLIEDDFASKPGPTVKLKKGKNAIRAEYASPKDGGEATIRLLWSAKEFIPESVPPTLFTHEASDKPLREQERIRAGRMLVAELRCLKCHTSEAAGAMPEMSADTPSLEDVGQRYTQAWLALWINNPHEMRPDTVMPRVFASAGDALDQRARDIAGYLVESSAKTQATAEPDATTELVAHGTRLYTTLGCVACHVQPDQTPAPDAPQNRVSHKFVKAKFQPGALKAFLLKPEAHYQWIKMPDFRLSDEEADALVAFLRSRKSPELKDDVSGDPKRGKELFQSSGCLSCHSMKLENAFKAKPLAQLSDWTRGCVAGDASRRGNAPDFSLNDEQRASILALAATNFESLKRDTPAEFAERQVVALNCTACHARDKQDDAWSGLSAEVAALTQNLPPEDEKSQGEISGDQSRPPLTWVGEKLRPQWMATFIGGQLGYKPRPWLAARMPGFPARAKMLAEGLAASHGCPPMQPPPGKPDEKLAEIGRTLAGKAGGFSCIQCHSVGDQKALAAFEAPAINFGHVTDRLTREYYDRWVYNPQRVLPGTRMPQFADNNGKSALKDIQGGDARKQYDAIWNYLLAGDKIVPPANP